MSEALAQQQVQAYQRDGYLVVNDLITPEEVSAFVEYAGRPRPADAQQAGPLQIHTVDRQWAHLAKHPRIVPIVEQLMGGDARIVQTMYLNKPPSGGQGIALHQDTHYLRNEPNTLMACWLALSDTDAGNGGLCVVAGTHRGPLFAASRNQNDEQVSWEMEHLMRDRDGRQWKEKLVSFHIEQIPDEQIIRLAVPAGSGVFFTGMTVHGSFANRSADRPRRAFATHYVREGTWLFRDDVQQTVPARP